MHTPQQFGKRFDIFPDLQIARLPYRAVEILGYQDTGIEIRVQNFGSDSGCNRRFEYCQFAGSVRTNRALAIGTQSQYTLPPFGSYKIYTISQATFKFLDLGRFSIDSWHLRERLNDVERCVQAGTAAGCCCRYERVQAASPIGINTTYKTKSTAVASSPRVQ